MDKIELGSRLTKELDDLSESVYRKHLYKLFGREEVVYLRNELQRIQDGVAKEYLKVAPEDEVRLSVDLANLSEAIDAFERAGSVSSRWSDDKLSLTGGGLARRTGPNELTTVSDEQVPVFVPNPGLSGFFGGQTFVGNRSERVVRTFNRRTGRETGKKVYYQDCFGRPLKG